LCSNRLLAFAQRWIWPISVTASTPTTKTAPTVTVAVLSALVVDVASEALVRCLVFEQIRSDREKGFCNDPVEAAWGRRDGSDPVMAVRGWVGDPCLGDPLLLLIAQPPSPLFLQSAQEQVSKGHFGGRTGYPGDAGRRKDRRILGLGRHGG
jgi:hypothetical protein